MSSYLANYFSACVDRANQSSDAVFQTYKCGAAHLPITILSLRMIQEIQLRGFIFPLLALFHHFSYLHGPMLNEEAPVSGHYSAESLSVVNLNKPSYTLPIDLSLLNKT